MPVKDHGSSKMQMWFSTPLRCSGSDFASMGLASTVTLKRLGRCPGNALRTSERRGGVEPGGECGPALGNHIKHPAAPTSVFAHTCVKGGPIAVWAPCELPSRPAAAIEHIAGAFCRLRLRAVIKAAARNPE